MKIKICPRCKRELLLFHFTKDKHTKTGLNCWCKQCDKDYYYLKHPRILKEKQLKQELLNRGLKICTICKNEKPLTDFNKGSYKNRLESECKNCNKKRLKKYRKTHKLIIAKKAQIYREKNRNKIDVVRKKYSKSVNGIYTTLKASAKNRRIKFSINLEDFSKWYSQQEQMCCYCNRTIEEIQKDNRERESYRGRLSFDRRNNTIDYILNNLTLACYRCNMIKGEYFTEQEMLKIAKHLY